jgi:HAAS domain-containing protein
MSDREFENYLALLSRLLRLSGEHRARIAGELRSHMEDRLDDLLAQGMPREAAVRQALEEFGDAAGLAGQFVAISRSRKRRWLMRAMTFSVAATVLLAAGLAIFWPGRNAAPGVAAAVAQAEAGAPLAGGGPADAVPGEPSLQEKLNKRVDLEVVEMPLKDVIAYLQENSQIQFVIQKKKLEEAALTPDHPVTVNLKRVRLSTLLDLMLKDLELTYVEKDDLVLITTPEDAEATMEIRVYDCRDLLAMPAPAGADKFIPGARGPGGKGGMFSVADEVRLPGAAVPPAGNGPPEASGSRSSGPGSGGGGGLGGRLGSDGVAAGPVSEHDVRAARLMEIITTNVDNQSWGEVGGPGSISEFNGLIVVTQTAQTHKKIEHVLDMLRQAAGLDAAKVGKVVR